MTSFNWRNYTANDGTQCRKHSHDGYIRGWVHMLEWREIGLHGFPDNPYSKYYLTDLHNSFDAGVKDAYLYLTSE